MSKKRIFAKSSVGQWVKAFAFADQNLPAFGAFEFGPLALSRV